MNWENILKISTEDAINDAKRFVPEDIEAGKKDMAERDKKLERLHAEKTLPKRQAKVKLLSDWLESDVEINRKMLDVFENMLMHLKENLMDIQTFDRFWQGTVALLVTTPNNPLRRG